MCNSFGMRHLEQTKSDILKILLSSVWDMGQENHITKGALGQLTYSLRIGGFYPQEIIGSHRKLPIYCYDLVDKGGEMDNLYHLLVLESNN